MSVAQLYSRDRTLSTVEENQFKLFLNLVNKGYISNNKFKDATSSLVQKKGNALFHIALVTNNSCIENSNHKYNKPLLCSNFKDSNEVSKIILAKSKKSISKKELINSSEYSTTKLGIKDLKNKCYLIKKINNSNDWLIAKNRYLSSDTEMQKFLFFIKNRYVQTTSLRSKFYATRYNIYFISLISFLLWFLNRQRNKNNLKKYTQSKVESSDVQVKIKEIIRKA